LRGLQSIIAYDPDDNDEITNAIKHLDNNTSRDSTADERK